MKKNLKSHSDHFLLLSTHFIRFRALAQFQYYVCLATIIWGSLILSTLVYSSKTFAKKPLVMPKLERARVQNRFQPRLRRLSTNTRLGAHIRDDYYDSFVGGLGVEYFINDQWGIGLNYSCLWTTLSDEAEKLRDSYGLVPDARPQQEHWSLSALYGLGYGKMLLFGNIIYFEPLLAIDLGFANAEERTLPTLKLAFLPTFLLQNGFGIRFDLGITMQIEERSRGLVFTTGFMPMLSLAWSRQLWPEKQSN
ncbi:MAG: hypothetical protein CMH49_09510 [Myxococcales bacterium]|nr:hypothetical protein [Myxococcales bacterium]